MALFNNKVEMTLHTLTAFIPNYSIIVWPVVNFFNVYGHLLCYNVTYCVDEGQSPVTSRQFGPSDSQNRYTASLLSPHCVTVLCYTSLLAKEVDLVDNFIGFVLQWRVHTVFLCTEYQEVTWKNINKIFWIDNISAFFLQFTDSDMKGVRLARARTINARRLFRD